VRLDLGDGIVARVENNPLFVRHGFWGELRPIFTEFDAIRDPVAKNDAYRRAALAFVAEDPLRFLAMGARRLGRFYSPVIDQDEHFASRRARLLAFPISLLIVGAAALYAIRRKPPGELRRLAPLLVIIVALTLVHTLVHGLVRYRVPLMPLLAVLASAGVCRLIAPRRVGAV
jgi:hypothetical protein